MVEYIERNALIAEFKRLTLGENSLVERLFADGVYAVIETFPAADVVEVRHGHWIDLNAENSTGPLFKCSECSHLHNPNRNDLDLERVELNPLYCDACGARMAKEEEHEVG